MKTIGCWVTTVVLAFGVLSGGVAELAHRRDNVEGIVRLGYPLYFITILGFSKVLGGVAVLAPHFPRLKEWAYAGIFFNCSKWRTAPPTVVSLSSSAAWPNPFSVSPPHSYARHNTRGKCQSLSPGIAASLTDRLSLWSGVQGMKIEKV